MKAALFFALERELVERNVTQRFRPFEGGKSERHVGRGGRPSLCPLDAVRHGERR